MHKSTFDIVLKIHKYLEVLQGDDGVDYVNYRGIKVAVIPPKGYKNDKSINKIQYRTPVRNA